MFNFIGRKKINASKLGKLFTKTLINLGEKNFPDFITLVENIEYFESKPSIDLTKENPFLLIIIAANLIESEQYLAGEIEDDFFKAVYLECATIFNSSEEEFKSLILSYRSYLKKINYPSKKIKYSISKAIFFKYNFNSYQAEYFKSQNYPNPVILKKMDEATLLFFWNWEEFISKYKIS